MLKVRRDGRGHVFREFIVAFRIDRLVARCALGALIGAVALQAQAAIAFSDDFNDNDVSDWTFSTNYGGAAGTETGGILGPYIDAPPGGFDLVARSTRALTLSAGDYTLDLDAMSIDCDGCTISYDVLFDNVLLTRTASFEATQHRSFDLGELAGGSHGLTLGMHTTNASSGHFVARFDNVVLDRANVVPPGPGVPEPSTWALMLLGFGTAGALLRRRRLRPALTPRCAPAGPRSP
jgi:hypothetical protein